MGAPPAGASSGEEEVGGGHNDVGREEVASGGRSDAGCGELGGSR
jgi:hypothetical protein